MELLDIYDENGNKTGKTVERGKQNQVLKVDKTNIII